MALFFRSYDEAGYGRYSWDHSTQSERFNGFLSAPSVTRSALSVLARGLRGPASTANDGQTNDMNQKPAKSEPG